MTTLLIRWGADKSLARPNSRCRRTESVVSLERGVCSCAELQVFSCYRGWKETCQATRAISTTSKGVLFLHNAPAHWALATQKKLAYLGFQCLDHPPYSPDPAPSDYHLFRGLKKQLKGRHFSSDAVIAAAETWLDGQSSEFFFWMACKS